MRLPTPCLPATCKPPPPAPPNAHTPTHPVSPPPPQAYARCHKANPTDAAACNNLHTSLVMCYAAGEDRVAGGGWGVKKVRKVIKVVGEGGR